MYIYFGLWLSPVQSNIQQTSCSKTETSNIFCSQVKFQYMDNACFELYTYIIGGGDLQGPKQKVPWLRKEDNCGIKMPLLFAGDCCTALVHSSYINWITTHIQVNKSYRFGIQLFSSSKCYFEDHRICHALIVKIQNRLKSICFVLRRS